MEFHAIFIFHHFIGMIMRMGSMGKTICMRLSTSFLWEIEQISLFFFATACFSKNRLQERLKFYNVCILFFESNE